MPGFRFRGHIASQCSMLGLRFRGHIVMPELRFRGHVAMPGLRPSVPRSHRNAGALVSRSHRHAGASVPRSHRNAGPSVPRQQPLQCSGLDLGSDALPISQCQGFGLEVTSRCPCLGSNSEVKSQCPDLNIDAHLMPGLRFRARSHRNAGVLVPGPHLILGAGSRSLLPGCGGRFQNRISGTCGCRVPPFCCLHASPL